MMNPILLELPETIETERLLIRPPLPGDGKEMNAAIRETFDDLHVWMDWAKEVPSEEESETYARLGRAKFLERSDIPLLIFLKGTSTLVGASGLHPKNWSVPSFMIGYWRRMGFEGQGYITEAVRGVTRFGFETMRANRIYISCDTRNVRSRNVAERAGYRLEGVFRNDAVAPDGSLRDTFIFGMTPEDCRASGS